MHHCVSNWESPIFWPLEQDMLILHATYKAPICQFIQNHLQVLDVTYRKLNVIWNIEIRISFDMWWIGTVITWLPIKLATSIFLLPGHKKTVAACLHRYCSDLRRWGDTIRHLCQRWVAVLGSWPLDWRHQRKRTSLREHDDGVMIVFL